MFTNYIFDFGQVLVKFDPIYMTKAYIENDDDVKLVSEVVFDRLYWDKLDAGKITDDEIINDITKRLPERLLSKACLVYNNWLFNLPAIDGMKDIIKELKQNGAKIYLLSNISTQFAKRYINVKEICELFSLFDGLVFSGPIGLTKPNIEIFEHIVTKYSLKKEESIFIDDNSANVEGAKSAGLNAYLFDGDAKKLKKFLNIGVKL